MGSVFGDFLGSMATDDLEKSSQDTQENRISFYTKLEGSLEDSYYQLCVAKSAFDELYDMESIELEEGLEEGSFNDADAVYLALQDYMTALRRYADDLNNAKMFWDISLSDKEDAFVDGVQKQLQNAYNVVNAGINIGILSDPYDDAEEQARYVSLMDDYIEFLNLSMIYSTSESTFSHVSNVTAYGVGNFEVYYKGVASIPIIMAEEQLNTNWHAQRYLWVYDTEGNPIYVSNRYGTTYIKNCLVMKYIDSGVANDENFGITIYNIAVRIREDLLSGQLGKNYKNYAL